MNAAQLWRLYQHYLCRVPALGLTLDVSRMGFEEGFIERMGPALSSSFAGMEALEKGAIANPDENRMVGHYWLRNPDLAPAPEIAAEIRKTVADVKSFAAAVHDGTVRPAAAPRFTRFLSIGIGGAGPRPPFVARAPPAPPPP